ncbi:MAG: UvrD-helicase domain-containing protein [Xanthomonadales bacterium]|nr:UvrD-helicase domain-containing protein [Xanthomonadales bacterium]
MSKDASTPLQVPCWSDLALGRGGRSLIEASAGTGKTWTISVLYLRLLLEQGLGPRRIVVTTFTDAAAGELRERIRGRIGWALALAVRNETPQGTEADLAWLAKRWADDGGGFDAGAARADATRLRLALADLDLAPIGTLHSLCRHILTDFPFDCGMGFELGELVDASAVEDELFDDAWRRLVQAGGEPTAEQQALIECKRDGLRRHLRCAMQPGVGVAVLDDQAVAGFMDPAKARWLRDWVDATSFTRSNAKLRTSLLALADHIDQSDGAHDAAALVGRIDDALARTIDKDLRPESIAAGSYPQVLEFAERAAGILSQLEKQPLARALAECAAALRTQLRQRLAATGRLTFDALIERVHEALAASSGNLADRLFETWPVALVDEFQDTDALQYGILDRIYREAPGAALRGRLVMIGDPKQAIYRFRGGDIHAYLAARRVATDGLALTTNFRSAGALVGALNALYATAGLELSTDHAHEIRYEAVTAQGRGAAPYTTGGKACARPLEFHYWPEPPDKAPARREAALEACANQIVALLSGGHAIGGQPLAPGNITVLLPKNDDVADLRAKLETRKVPCVSSSKAGVFDCAWARELQLVLHAVLNHRDEGALRAALATPFGGLDYQDLRGLGAEAAAWQRHAAAFAALDELWRERGVLAVVQRLVEHARARLFARPDHERALTDIRHLGELLQARSDALPGREQLLAWLARERAGKGQGGDAAEEQQLRIESDAARVTLMTLHASKGLEFDVVLLPLMWANCHNGKDKLAVIHDAEGRRVLAFGRTALEIYRQEGQDERFRLLYVALTRARHACHVYALPPGRRKDGNSKDPGIDPERSPLDAMLEKLLASGKEKHLDGVAWHEGEWSWKQREWQAPAAPADAGRKVRGEPAPVPFESHYSFSALANGARHLASDERAASDEEALDEADDVDDPFAAEPPRGSPHPELALLRPLAGIEFGHAVHAMYERRAIGTPMADQCALVTACLRDEGVRLGALDADEAGRQLAARLDATLAVPLLPGRAGSPRLGALPAAAQIAEMAFSFVLDEVSLAALRRACDFVPESPLATLRGYLSGKIDLVFGHGGRFHVLDYKTNLSGGGEQLADYAPAALERLMDKHHYRFQALLYTIAVDRYLRQRLPAYRRSEQLGETIYLFVRAAGIDPAQPALGLWSRRFDDDLLDAVDRVLAGVSRAREAA